jgi:hypothetical protein
MLSSDDQAITGAYAGEDFDFSRRPLTDFNSPFFGAVILNDEHPSLTSGQQDRLFGDHYLRVASFDQDLYFYELPGSEFVVGIVDRSSQLQHSGGRIYAGIDE